MCLEVMVGQLNSIWCKKSARRLELPARLRLQVKCQGICLEYRVPVGFLKITKDKEAFHYSLHNLAKVLEPTLRIAYPVFIVKRNQKYGLN